MNYRGLFYQTGPCRTPTKTKPPFLFAYLTIYTLIISIDNARPPKTTLSIATFRPYEQKRTKGNAHQELIARTKNNFPLGALNFLNPV